MTPKLVLLAAFLALTATARAEVYQYAVPSTDEKGRAITAFLWVPPGADRIRGVLVGGQTLMEPAFVRDPAIRAVCAEEKLAIVYFQPALAAVFEYWKSDCGARLQKALDDLARESGYEEIAVAPLFPFGHSVSSLFASRVVCWARDRCFGALAFKGGLDVPADHPAASLLGVPILVIKGQFEEFGPGPSGGLRENEDREVAWKGMREGILARRDANERNLISYLVESGATHFAWSERLAPFTAEFIRQAARRRIPDWPRDAKAPVKCRELAVADGALTGLPGGENGAASFAEFGGEKARTFWHLDLALARAADAFHADLGKKQPQFVTFADSKTNKPLFVGHDLRLRMPPHWIGADTFQVAGTFLDHAPDKYPKLNSPDAPAVHAAGAVQFRVFGGAIEQIARDAFRVAPTGREPLRANILAFHPGDATYRHAEQQGRIDVPEALKRGRAQTITFPEIAPLKRDSPPLKLAATSDSGLPVRFHVESGPAIIDGDTLRLAEIPARAKFPLNIVVVATEYGSAIEPLVQSAPPVRQSVAVEPAP